MDLKFAYALAAESDDAMGQEGQMEGGGGGDENLDSLSREELADRAKARGLQVNEGMSKKDLLRAIRNSTRQGR